MPDSHANFATSLVATAPSPAASGTSVVVTAAEGARFPAVPFNAVICPAASDATPANAEVVRVTARSTDTLTITRAQESSSARTVVVGDRIYAGVTVKTLTDVETDAAAGQPADELVYSQHTQSAVVGGTTAATANRLYAVRVIIPKTGNLRDVSFFTGTATGNALIGGFDCGVATPAVRTQLAGFESGSIAFLANGWITYDPNFAVTKGQHIDLCIVSSSTGTIGRGGTLTANNMLLPTGFLPGAVSALPKLCWARDVGSFDVPASVTEANCLVSNALSLVVAARIS